MTNEQKLVKGIRQGIMELASLPGILDEDIGGGPTEEKARLTENEIENQKRLDEERYRRALIAGYRGSYEDFIEIPQEG